jgi:methylenetetrahydrofolate dehydrogenase (NADP+)/methenyltetrahydrofolate cyclohydrolase
MTALIQGAPLAKRIRADVAERAARLRDEGIEPRLAAVLATSDTGAISYAQSKAKTAASLGIRLDVIDLGSSISQAELEDSLRKLGAAAAVHGILLESPLAKGLDFQRALDCIPTTKDVDGLTPTNLGRITAGNETRAIAAATPLACIELAESLGPLAGKRVAVVGRGRTVGRPLIGLLLNRDATPTVCHTKTPALDEVLASCDLVIVAIGRPRAITAHHLREGHVVIDAGINIEGDKVVGDVDADAVASRGVAAITPVPGGVGPVTTAIVFRNLLRAIDLQRQERTSS